MEKAKYSKHNMIPLNRARLSTEGKHELRKVIDSGWWTTGKKVEELEKEFAEYVGARYAIAVSSCSAGLHMAMKSSAIKGDIRDTKLYTTSMTFCSTINSYLHAGGRDIQFIDTYSFMPIMDEFKLEEYLENNLYYRPIILPVHFGGDAMNMDHIKYLAKTYDAFVIEDCAHAVETTISGKHVGLFGDVGVFSFNPTKNVTAPEMGMVVTGSKEIAESIRLMRLHCLSSDAYSRINSPGQYDVVDLGFKYNPTDIEAVFALDSLRNIKSNWEKRFQLCQGYYNMIERVRELSAYDGWSTSCLSVDPYKRHGLHLFMLTVGNRDHFIKEMKERDLCCGIHYKPVHLHPYYEKFNSSNLNNTEWFGERLVSLPFGPNFSDDEMDYMIRTTQAILLKGRYLCHDNV